MTRLQYTAIKTTIYYCLCGSKDRRAHLTSGLGPHGIHGSGRWTILGAAPQGPRVGDVNHRTVNRAGPSLPSLGWRGSDRRVVTPLPPSEGARTLATSLEFLHPLGEGNAIDASRITSSSLLRWSPSTLGEATARHTKTGSSGGKCHTSSSPSPPKRWI